MKIYIELFWFDFSLEFFYNSTLNGRRDYFLIGIYWARRSYAMFLYRKRMWKGFFFRIKLPFLEIENDKKNRAVEKGKGVFLRPIITAKLFGKAIEDESY